MPEARTVRTAQELQAALAEGATRLEISGTITGLPRLVLELGVRLRGGRLELGSDGIVLRGDNTLEDLEVLAPATGTALRGDTGSADWGTLILRRVRATGQVAFIADDAVRSGRIVIEDLHVASADVRERADGPLGPLGTAMQGALTIWNRHADPAALLTAELSGIAAGSAGSPIRGGGILLAGHGHGSRQEDVPDAGGASGAPGADTGTLTVRSLRTGEITTDGGLPDGTPDRFSAGILVAGGALLGTIACEGAVTTHGRRDLALVNAGGVMGWSAEQPITTHGAEATAILSVGETGTLEIEAPVETTGAHARGLALDAGSMIEAFVGSILTRGAGSAGVELARHLPTLMTDGDLATLGDAGDRDTGSGAGADVDAGADATRDGDGDVGAARAMAISSPALRIASGGGIEVLEVGGSIRTSGDRVAAVELAGSVGAWRVRGGILATGARADGVHHAPGIEAPSGVEITAVQGEPAVAIP